MEKILLSWSGGKDSTMTLYEIQRSGKFEVVALLTTVTEGYDRISMHGVRRALLERQAEALDLRLHKVLIPIHATNEQYEREVREALETHLPAGIRTVAFGDLFLEDIKRYREEKLAKVGMLGLFPLWRRDTREMAETFVALGFKAVTVCVNPQNLDGSFVGRMFDRQFLDGLPAGVDPCGENGEFHSFVFDGPLFNRKVGFTLGEAVLRDSFWFCDLVPEEPAGNFSPIGS